MYSCLHTCLPHHYTMARAPADPFFAFAFNGSSCCVSRSKARKARLSSVLTRDLIAGRAKLHVGGSSIIHVHPDTHKDQAANEKNVSTHTRQARTQHSHSHSQAGGEREKATKQEREKSVCNHSSGLRRPFYFFGSVHLSLPAKRRETERRRRRSRCRGRPGPLSLSQSA